MIYVLHSEDDKVVIGGQAYWRCVKKQPKAYASERNARIAVSNMSGKEQIVPYVAVNDPDLIKHIATFLPMEQGVAEGFIAELLVKFVKESEVNAEEKGRAKP